MFEFFIVFKEDDYKNKLLSKNLYNLSEYVKFTSETKVLLFSIEVDSIQEGSDSKPV